MPNQRLRPSRDADAVGMTQQQPITRLHIDDGVITLEVPGRGVAEKITLNAGSLQAIFQHLRHEPAKENELEAAIATIEDAIMPIIRRLPVGGSLVTSVPMMQQIAKAAGNTGTDRIQIEIAAVEQQFNQLVDIAYGVPVNHFGVPVSRDFAAHLLLLRELMHHAGFTSVLVLP